MKKHAIAVAVAAAVSASAPVFAQNVTLFGVFDASVVSINKVPDRLNFGTAPGFSSNSAASNARAPGAYASTTSADRFTGIIDGGTTSSRWGMRGTEDLGGGLSALFYLEGDINLQGLTHSAGLFRRGAYTGLASKEMGELTIGTRVNPVIATYGAFMPVMGNGVSSITAAGVGFADFYTKNAITYTSPNISGIVLQAQHGFSQDSTSSADGSVGAASAVWTGKDLTLRAAYQNRRGTTNVSQAVQGANAGSTSGLSADKNTTILGGSYKLSPTVTIAIGTFKNTVNNPVTKNNLYDLSGNQYGVGWQASPALLLGANVTTAEGTSMTNLQARYTLSKRTMAYTQVINTDNGTKVAFNPAAASTNTWGGTADTTGVQISGCQGGACAIENVRQTSVGFGIVHSF